MSDFLQKNSDGLGILKWKTKNIDYGQNVKMTMLSLTPICELWI